MSTKIEWTEETWNPTTGCDRVSPGCDNCYALTLAKRLKAIGQAHYQNDGDPRTSGPGFALTVHPDSLDKPLHWRKPRTVFVNSMSDLFHPSVPDAFIRKVLAVCSLTPHTFQVLTKRPQRMSALLSAHNARYHVSNARYGFNAYAPAINVGDWPLRNVWLGTSIENDKYAFRANHLRETPAAVRFLSLEPLLGPLPSLDLTGIDWVIVGGESGPGARPMHPAWVRDIRDRCVAAGVAFFFKQWGAWLPEGQATNGPLSMASFWTRQQVHPDGSLRYSPRSAGVYRVGKKTAGRTLDGRTWDEMPAKSLSQRVTFGVPEFRP